MKTAIGVDIGGTKTNVGLIGEDGEIIDLLSFATSYSRPVKLKEDILDYIEKIINKNEDPVCGVGIASAGRVDYQKKQVVYATDNLVDWARVPIVKETSEKFKLPVFLDNDVNAALNCELQWGDFSEKQMVIFLTIGTGLGGAVAHRGEIIRGRTGSAGEFGHMILYPRGRDCSCGKQGCAEQYISGPAYRRKLKKSFRRENIRPGKELLTTEVIAQNIRNKNEPYYAVFLDMLTDLVYLLESLKNCLDYEVCVIGGGFSEYGALILHNIEEKFRNYNHKYSRRPEFVISREKNRSGVIGAGLMAIKEIEK